MEKRYPVMELAHYIINKCTVDEEYISNLQLQKILFYIQQKYLKDYKRTIFEEEIQAWPFGPVVPEVYYEYCGYGAMIIDSEYDTNIGNDDRAIMDPLIEEKRVLLPWNLVGETHKRNGAWSQIFRDGNGNRQRIPTDFIERY